MDPHVFQGPWAAHLLHVSSTSSNHVFKKDTAPAIRRLTRLLSIHVDHLHAAHVVQSLLAMSAWTSVLARDVKQATPPVQGSLYLPAFLNQYRLAVLG